MSVQTTYGSVTPKGVAGGIFDMYYYQIDSRVNEEDSGKLRCGVGVVAGTIPGSNIKLPTTGKKAADFEGVVVNGFTNQHDLEGHVTVAGNASVGVMRKGRIWVRVKSDAQPKYGDALHLIVEEGADAGLFATEGGEEIAGRFLGPVNNGIAPAELYGVTVTSGGGSSPDLSQYQKKITVTGILKGTGDGNIVQAQEGTDYQKPSEAV